MTVVTTDLLDRPDARITFDVRGTGPLLVLVGSPMGAEGFGPLADAMAADHTVVTFDPRGTGRSPADDPDADSTVAVRSADLAALLERVGGAPATLFGSSGGAVVALALAQSRPELVGVVVAHEPPLEELLPDAAEHRAATEQIIGTYREQGAAAAWALFLASAGLPGAAPDDAAQNAADGAGLPATDGDATAQQAADERHFFLHEMRETVRWRPDPQRLRGRRVVVGIGSASAGQICDRTSRALAAELDRDPEPFPGGHVGWLEDPAGFVARLREVLART
ncbi:alpha/beta fold hydrolase [Pseudonocardia alni]|uniref:alpha/beta fold hydrolase n=1 Tax=Pseudonocardia alni TaxID=33907 RepID=UPI001FCB83BC|nr:alpha/beta hydrolase [Pseudonocardia alni]MBO4239163.1 alpha/beta fold hydrolase [Pseudonocardia alni]